MGLRDEYPYIWADCVMWGSYAYYFRQQYELAKETNAPRDAVSHFGTPGKDDFGWRTIDQYDEWTRTRYERTLEHSQAVVPQ